MRVKILGCHSALLPGNRLTGMVIDGVLALDAGGLASALSLEEQARIKYILITHSHLDHIKDIAFVADNVSGKNDPIELVSVKEVLGLIKKHFLNGKIWPDFTRLPTPSTPTLKYRAISVNRPMALVKYTIRAVRTNHSVPSVAYFISDQKETLLFTSDTGPTAAIWKKANSLKDLKAVFVEVTFPNSMQTVADNTKHLTPQSLRRELEKLKVKTRLYAYHLKGQFEKTILAELAEFCPGVKSLREGEIR